MILAEVRITKDKNIRKIALVNRPAIELDFLHMSEDCTDDREVISDEMIPLVLEYLKSVGRTLKQLEEEEGLVLGDGLDMAISSDPNQPSSQDTDTQYVRYYYSGPRDDKNRKFCADVLDLDLWYRKEDIDQMSFRRESQMEKARPDGGYYPPQLKQSYSIFKYKGGWQCRHEWDKKTFLKSSKITFGSDRLTLGVDEEKHNITGPVLVPNKRIYRSAKFFGGTEDGYIVFSKDTIREVAMDYLNNGNDINLDHNNDMEVSSDDIQIVEQWLIETEHDKTYDLGYSKEDCPMGTLMQTQHINSMSLWEDVKSGKYKGFSVQGNPVIRVIASGLEMERELEEDRIVNEIVEIIKNNI